MDLIRGISQGSVPLPREICLLHPVAYLQMPMCSWLQLGAHWHAKQQIASSCSFRILALKDHIHITCSIIWSSAETSAALLSSIWLPFPNVTHFLMSGEILKDLDPDIFLLTPTSALSAVASRHRGVPLWWHGELGRWGFCWDFRLGGCGSEQIL